MINFREILIKNGKQEPYKIEITTVYKNRKILKERVKKSNNKQLTEITNKLQ